MQRGVNRAALFIDDEDRCHYLRLLRNACRKQAVAIHAFVLMGNHVHLLITPSTAEGLAPAMRQCGQNYVQYFNKRHVRSGTLLEGRFKSCLVDSDGYLLMVHRYIELNPVRAAMVAFPEEYRWSSVRVYLGLEHNPMLTPHPCYTFLGQTAEARANAYSEWLRPAFNQTNESGSWPTSHRSARWVARASKTWLGGHCRGPWSAGRREDRSRRRATSRLSVSVPEPPDTPRINYLRPCY